MTNDIVQLNKEALTIETELNKPEIYNDFEKAGELNKKLEGLKKRIATMENIEKLNKQLIEINGLITAEEAKTHLDEPLINLLKEEQSELNQKITTLTEDLREKDEAELIDQVVIEIRAAAGGDEASIFAGNLYKLYTLYAERQKWKVNMINFSKSGLGATKEICFEIKGPLCYVNLRGESGVHRVQRIPVTEKKGRVHTSTATVAVLPLKEKTDLVINPSDLKIDCFRAGGAGGQHVNKTESAVRITHIPTGIGVVSQDQRSQHQNKAKAMQVLTARLEELKNRTESGDIGANRKDQVGTGDRSEKIKTYNYQQDRLTDHRIGKSYFGLEKYLDGEIEEIVEDYKTFLKTGKKFNESED